MPQAAKPDCYFCAGSGTVLPERESSFVQGGRCVCTVLDEEVIAALPELFATILKNAGKES
jgi:hypothetical protein